MKKKRIDGSRKMTQKEKKALKKIIKKFGTQRNLGKQLGIPYPTIQNWMVRGRPITPLYVVTLERASEGEVLRHELRPDIFPPEEGWLIEELYNE